MNNEFYPLDCDDDVLLFVQETFLVGRFRGLVLEQWRNKFNWGQNNQAVKNVFLNLSIGEAHFRSGDIKWNSSSEGIKCQLLKVGGKNWERGKLRIQVSINLIPTKNPMFSPNVNIQVCLEFCPDEPKQPESPLDDIRKMLKDEQ